MPDVNPYTHDQTFPDFRNDVPEYDLFSSDVNGRSILSEKNLLAMICLKWDGMDEAGMNSEGEVPAGSCRQPWSVSPVISHLYFPVSQTS